MSTHHIVLSRFCHKGIHMVYFWQEPSLIVQYNPERNEVITVGCRACSTGPVPVPRIRFPGPDWGWNWESRFFLVPSN